MDAFIPIGNTAHRLVVAVDFGTTYSGISWAHTAGMDRGAYIDDWPSSRSNLEGRYSPKAPTLLRYLNDSQVEWGYQIARDVQPQEVLSLFKLALYPNRFKGAIEDLGIPRNFENVDKNITDYLSGLYEHFLRTIKVKIGQAVFESTPVNFIVTVPAIWSEVARQRTLNAFERVPNLPDGHTTTLCSEPEAAAISAIGNLGRHDLKLGDSFVVVDAGGGTADLITYTITGLDPVLEVVEATEGTGDICGSNRINDRFIQLITSRFSGEEGWDEDLLHDAVEHFEKRTKKAFTVAALAQQEVFTIPMHGLNPNEELGINRRGRLLLKAEEMHMLFEPEVVKIIHLVKEQIAVSGVPIRKVLLVGGFGSSIYLRERLQIAIQDDASTGEEIEVFQPRYAWACTMSGAVMKGLQIARPKNKNYDVPTIKARTGRKHYGYEFSVQYNSAKHESLYMERFYDDSIGAWKVFVMEWFIKRGDLVSEDRPFRTTFNSRRPVSTGRPRSIICTVFVDESSEVAPLARDDNVRVLCHVTASLDHIPESELDRRLGIDGAMYYDLEIQIEAVYQSSLTVYTLIHKGRRYESVTAENSPENTIPDDPTSFISKSVAPAIGAQILNPSPDARLGER
ncbi:hypothetical protein F4818DRAFT_453039 [Hypoxylon cercidicola]|nr:hypothetical protein F4818DRAFT_453039 [Hypoxylon cercidicola]